jgi:hypothetical protein
MASPLFNIDDFRSESLNLTMTLLLEAVKSNGLEPLDYLNHMINQNQNFKPHDTIDHLLP